MAAEAQDAPVGVTYASETEAENAGRLAVAVDSLTRYVVRVGDVCRVLTIPELIASEGDGEVVTTLRKLVYSDDLRRPLAETRAGMRAAMERAEAKYGVSLAPQGGSAA